MLIFPNSYLSYTYNSINSDCILLFVSIHKSKAVIVRCYFETSINLKKTRNRFPIKAPCSLNESDDLLSRALFSKYYVKLAKCLGFKVLSLKNTHDVGKSALIIHLCNGR